MDSKIRVRCNECGRKWKVSLKNDFPQCSRCNSVDIDILDAYVPASSPAQDFGGAFDGVRVTSDATSDA